MSTYEIGYIGFGDVGQIVRLGKLCLPIYYGSIELFTMLVGNNTVLLKIYHKADSQKIIGFVIAEMKDNNGSKLHIMSLGVHPANRRQGLASMLIGKLMRSDKVKEISLYVLVDNHQAIGFYRKLGFVEEDRLINYYSSLNKDAFIYRYRKKIDSTSIKE